MKDIKVQCVIGIIGVTIALQCGGCRSAKPPPPVPQAITTAERTADQAVKFSQNEQWLAAAREWKRAADQYGLLNLQGEVAIAWHNTGWAEGQLTNFTQARQWLDQAAALNERLGLKAEWWRDQIALLQIDARAGDMNRFQERIETLQPKAEEIRDPSIKGLLLNELGLWQQSRGHMETAAVTFRNAEQQFASAQNAAGIATVHGNVARLQEKLGNFPAAIQAWRSALEKFEALAEPSGITSALAGLGRSYLGATNYSAAADYLLQAARNYRTLNKTAELSSTVDLLVKALNAQGKEADANAVRREINLELSKP